MSLVDCPKCGELLDFVIAQDGVDDTAEVMDAYCRNSWCGWEAIDPDLGDAVVEP